MDDADEGRRAFADAQQFSFASDDEAISFFNRHVPEGMKLLNAVCEAGSRETGELVVTFRLDGRFINPVGFICGGYIAQMLDQAAAYSSTFATGKASPSLDLHVRFIAPAKPGMFMAIGKVVKAGRSIAFLEAKLFDASIRLIATATVATQLVPASKPVESAARGPLSAKAGSGPTLYIYARAISLIFGGPGLAANFEFRIVPGRFQLNA